MDNSVEKTTINLWGIRQIRPISPYEIERSQAAQLETLLKGKAGGMNVRNTAEVLLGLDQGLYELPGYHGRTAREIISNLSPGSKMLDVACGQGNFGADIMGKGRSEAINPDVVVWGFDKLYFPGQDRLTHMVYGDVMRLNPAMFGDSFDGFKLVTSCALLKHLPDPWLAIRRMTSVLKPNGILLVTGATRVVSDEFGFVDEVSVEDERGYLETTDTGNISYSGDRGNVFDTSGRIVPPGEVVEILNVFQQGNFRLKYDFVRAKDVIGVPGRGGQISGQRLSASDNLRLSPLFYCQAKGSVAYLIARTPEETTTLGKNFINVEESVRR
ncbi:MAG TPA: methyltransferase domain-containing protein [Candidatus Bathyarchaeia archaeon]|nr:methyltransferase domain-containing protein [Candidatus Bathyarchaeia archaeon]